MKSTKTRDSRFELWLLLANTHTMMNKVRHRELRKFKVSPNTAGVLRCIDTLSGNATPAQISRWLIREPQSVSGILNRMTQRGLITKTADPVRKNVVRVNLTEKGRQIHDQIAKRGSIQRMMSYLTVEERQQLARLMKKIQKNLVEDENIHKQANADLIPRFLRVERVV
jgi:DNA-binding MarR family transcriptional regulator